MTIAPDDYRFLQEYVHQHSGIVVSGSKEYLFSTRLSPIAQKLGCGTIQELCRRLRTGAGSSYRPQIVEAMTTHETLFFRDTAFFDTLRTTVLPRLIERRRGQRRLGVWSAATSSGQEVYSLVMLLLEAGVGDWQLDLVATDLSHAVLDRARAGCYLPVEVERGLPSSYLQKYFRPLGREWQIAEEVRRRVRFSQLDLRTGPALGGPFDLVLCRNVLIYFDVPTKRTVLGHLRAALHPDGYLALGAGESLLNLQAPFRTEVLPEAVFHRCA